MKPRPWLHQRWLLRGRLATGLPRRLGCEVEFLGKRGSGEVLPQRPEIGLCAVHRTHSPETRALFCASGKCSSNPQLYWPLNLCPPKRAKQIYCHPGGLPHTPDLGVGCLLLSQNSEGALPRAWVTGSGPRYHFMKQIRQIRAPGLLDFLLGGGLGPRRGGRLLAQLPLISTSQHQPAPASTSVMQGSA